MKKSSSIFFLSISFFCQELMACDVMDDAGHQLHLHQPAKRILVLAPDLTEILFSVGAGSQVVGVMQGSDYPAAAKKIPIVATFNHLDREKILLLHPDLIVIWQDVSFLSELKNFPAPLYVSHPQKLLDISKTMEHLGCLTGHEKIAEQSATLFNKKYASLKAHFSKQKKLTVFYQVWPRPLITVSEKSWINEVITLCGGENIFAGLKNAAPLISQESVIAKNPEVILGTNVENWHAFPEVLAVTKNNIFSVDPDLIERAGPRILIGVEKICLQLEEARHATVRH